MPTRTKNDYDRAIADYDQAIKLRPGPPPSASIKHDTPFVAMHVADVAIRRARHWRHARYDARIGKVDYV
jgi:hypothetical protein